MANKTIYPYGVGGQTASGIEIIDDLEHNDATKALSAKQGKILADYVFAGSGTYGDAFEKSKTTTAYFPWLLIDEDEDGTPIKKMIWHAGNSMFIDAIGAEITGKKNGLTIVSENEGTMTLSFTGGSVALPIVVGEVNYSFNDIKTLANVSGYDGDYFSGLSVSGISAPKLEVDFGGMTFKWTSSGNNYFPAWVAGGTTTGWEVTTFKKIKRWNLNVSGNAMFEKQLELTHVELSGTWSYSTLKGFQSASTGTFKIQVADFKDLEVTSAVTSIEIFQSSANNYTLAEVDLRKFNTSNVTSLRIGFRCLELKKIIIGENFSNESVTTLGNGPRFVASNATIVCTSAIPPVLKNAVLSNGNYVHWEHDWVYYRVKNGGKILVPPGCADTYKNNVYIEPVNGEDVTITTDGKTTKTGWAMYADIIEEYEAGEY